MGPWAQGAHGPKVPWGHGRLGPWAIGSTGPRAHGPKGPKAQRPMDPKVGGNQCLESSFCEGKLTLESSSAGQNWVTCLCLVILQHYSSIPYLKDMLYEFVFYYLLLRRRSRLPPTPAVRVISSQLPSDISGAMESTANITGMLSTTAEISPSTTLAHTGSQPP